MNREIKFRAQRTDTKEFVYGYYHEVEAEGVGYSYIFWQGNTIPVRADSVGQFTGLLDKNGKEIYEGDVLLWKCSKSENKKEKLHIVSIEWGIDMAHGYSLTIYDNGEKWATSKSYWNASDREIIGNIYENPNLIN